MPIAGHPFFQRRTHCASHSLCPLLLRKLIVHSLSSRYSTGSFIRMSTMPASLPSSNALSTRALSDTTWRTHTGPPSTLPSSLGWLSPLRFCDSTSCKVAVVHDGVSRICSSPLNEQAIASQSSMSTSEYHCIQSPRVFNCLTLICSLQ